MDADFNIFEIACWQHPAQEEYFEGDKHYGF